MAQTNKLVIYESAMCCSSGVCGPRPNSSLIDLQDVLDKLIRKGVSVERYSITQNPKKFMEEPKISKLIQEQQLRALPITMLNGNIIKVGSYPTKEDLQDLTQAGTKTTEPPVAQNNTSMTDGCCSGKDSCDIRCSPLRDTPKQ